LFLTDVNENRYLYSTNKTIKKPAPAMANGCKEGLAKARIRTNGINNIPRTLLIIKTTKI
jgi:hypothetical protein